MIEFREEDHKKIVDLAKKAKMVVCELMDALSEGGNEYDDDFSDVEYRGSSMMRRRGGNRYRY